MITVASVAALVLCPMPLVAQGAQTVALFETQCSACHKSTSGFDAETGDLLWTTRADAHPLARITGAPALAGGRLYVPVASMEELAGGSPVYECCTFRGSVVAYDAGTDPQIWKRHTINVAPSPTGKTSRGTQLWGPAGAAVWSAPTIDLNRRLLYIATGLFFNSGYSTLGAHTPGNVLLAFSLR